MIFFKSSSSFNFCSGVYFFGGFNLLFLGIIGHYIAKIFEQAKNRPNYVVDKKINIKD